LPPNFDQSCPKYGLSSEYNDLVRARSIPTCAYNDSLRAYSIPSSEYNDSLRTRSIPSLEYNDSLRVKDGSLRGCNEPSSASDISSSAPPGLVGIATSGTLAGGDTAPLYPNPCVAHDGWAADEQRF
jgi:hypothetical protein